MHFHPSKFTDRPVILDGSTGMNLQKAGMSSGVCPEQWVLEHPDALIDLQRRFVQAGSNAVYAPTFGANRVKLHQYGLEDHTAEMNRELVRLSRKAVGEDAAVGGNLSSLGQFIEPFGSYTFEEIVEIYREQALALEEAGVDFFVAETLTQLFEARAALLAVRSVSQKPFIASITVESNGRMLGGTDPLTALTVMQSMGADAFGINCSNGPAEIAELLEQLAPHAKIPLLAKPNAGLPETLPDGTAHYHMTPEAFAAYAPRFAAAGAALIGGCCGTEPAHIAALSAAVTAPKQPAMPEETLLATEKATFDLDGLQPIGAPINAPGELADAILDCEADEDEVVVIALHGDDDISDLIENGFQLMNPVCFCTEDADRMEQALRVYQGRALMQCGQMAPETVAMLTARYGAIPCASRE